MKEGNQQLLATAYEKADPEIMVITREVIASSAQEIAAKFYEILQQTETAARVLSNELVESRLRPSMANWIISLFESRSAEEIVEFVERQERIGQAHARINISLADMNHATAIIKEETFRLLVNSSLDRSQLAESLVLASHLIDRSLALLNDAFVGDIVTNAKFSQSLKLLSSGPNLALQCERLRASLFDWSRKSLGSLFGSSSDARRVPSISHTDFGLWVQHKGSLLMDDSEEVSALRNLMTEMDNIFNEAINLRDQDKTESLRAIVKDLDSAITRATWLLAEISERSLALDGGKDPLTNLFNRRFLPVVMQQEIEMGRSSQHRFGVILFDLDHFKRINDHYGHDAGDIVLVQLGETLATSVRAGDFVFRYGGEEFLVVLSDVDEDSLRQIAENLRKRVAAHPFHIGNDTIVRITASLGMAMHDKHPDYTRTITAADHALQKAKNQGRDQSQMAENSFYQAVI